MVWELCCPKYHPGRRRLSPSHSPVRQWAAHKRNTWITGSKFLALKWSICEKFSHWLRGQTFTVWTDNIPLTYILTKPKLDACEQRWVAKLAPYTFDLKHIPGIKNTVADALSREPFATTVSHQIITEGYTHLLTEADGVSQDGVRDTFTWRLRLKEWGSQFMVVQKLKLILHPTSVTQW